GGDLDLNLREVALAAKGAFVADTVSIYRIEAGEVIVPPVWAGMIDDDEAMWNELEPGSAPLTVLQGGTSVYWNDARTQEALMKDPIGLNPVSRKNRRFV